MNNYEQDNGQKFVELYMRATKSTSMPNFIHFLDVARKEPTVEHMHSGEFMHDDVFCHYEFTAIATTLTCTHAALYIYLIDFRELEYDRTPDVYCTIVPHGIMWNKNLFMVDKYSFPDIHPPIVQAFWNMVEERAKHRLLNDLPVYMTTVHQFSDINITIDPNK